MVKRLVFGLVGLMMTLSYEGHAAIRDYGVLKARLVDTRLSTGPSSHFQILANGGNVHFRVVFTLEGPSETQQRVAILQDFRHPITDRISRLPDGWHPMTQTSKEGLDYLRGNLFQLDHIQFYRLQDLSDQLAALVKRISADPNARLYAFGGRWGPEPEIRDKWFGFVPGNGVHDLHYNQGNTDQFKYEDGVWQDGGLLVSLPNEGKWVGVFAMFPSQSLTTDNVTGHAISGVSTLPRAEGDAPGARDPRQSTLSNPQTVRAPEAAGRSWIWGWSLAAVAVVALLALAAIAPRAYRWAQRSPHPNYTGTATTSLPEDRKQITSPAETLPEHFDVFLCHNSADKREVKEICDRLWASGLTPWLDVDQLRPGRPWQELLERQISRIDSAAVFVGQSGVGPWQNRELRAFIDEFVRRDCPLIPVILPNAPLVPDLPLFLRQMTWVDFRAEPDRAFDKLIWGITGQRPVYPKTT